MISVRRTKQEIIEGVKNIETSKKMEGNTVKCKLTTGENIIILHKTVIISEKDGIHTLSSGGYRTPTTKDRLVKYSPARIYQKNSIWYINNTIFYDGIQVDSSGKVVSKELIPEKVEKKVIKMKSRINKFCDLITKDNLPVPSNGDCWYCLMKTNDNKSLGDATNNHSHLLEHLKEGYLHGSLLVNAMKEAGYRDEQIGFHYSMKLHDTFKRATRKYLQKRLLNYNG